MKPGQARVALALLLFPAPLLAQSLSVGEAARLVAERHPAAAGAQAAVARAESGVQEFEAARLPMLTTDASLTRYYLPMIVAPLHGLNVVRPPEFNRTLIQAHVGASYTLFDGGARGARIERAEALVGAAEANEAGVRNRLLTDGVRAYLRVLTAREVQSAQERRVNALTGERTRADQIFREGRAARLLLTRAEAALSAASADATTGRAEVEVAERDLARLTRLDLARILRDTLRPVRLASPALPGREEALARAREANPDLVRLRRQLAAAERGRAEARALWLPRINLNGRYIEFASVDGATDPEWQAGAFFSYPLFTGGSRAAAADRASAEIALARADLNGAELRIAEAVDRAFSAHEAARARADALRAAVTQAEEVARIERLALEAGSGVQSDYISAEAELFRVRAALTDATYAQVLARVELAGITGEISPDWIARNLESGS
ncbi:MAG: TolC family protein [Longimicrobiales bacterium]